MYKPLETRDLSSFLFIIIAMISSDDPLKLMQSQIRYSENCHTEGELYTISDGVRRFIQRYIDCHHSERVGHSTVPPSIQLGLLKYTL